MDDLSKNIYDFFFTGTKTEKGNRLFVLLLIIAVISHLIGYLKSGSWKKYSKTLDEKYMKRQKTRKEFFEKIFRRKKR